jgi:peptidoglycan/xylan/chitin deacetylase (PgdA/CDA1 family)
MKRWYIASGLSFVIAGVLVYGVTAHGWPLWSILVFTAVWLSFLTYASLTLPARIFVDAICTGKSGTLALTFDDGPHPTVTPALLDVLKKEGVKASFFCIGRHVEQDPAIAKRIVEEGHAIGIHSQDHHWSWGFASSRKVAEQITRCADAINIATGMRTRLFRPPFGVTNPKIGRAVRNTGVVTIGWDLRTFDTAREPDDVMRRIERRRTPGTIAVLHDTQPGTVELVARIIAHCRANGIELVRCDAHLRATA